MKIKKTLRGFTLAELMIVISIISILAVGISRLDFNRLSDRQRVQIHANSIVSLIEETRNNALIGRGIGVSLETPESWEITINSNSGITSSHTNPNGVYQTWEIPEGNYEITNLECNNLTGDSINTGVDEIEISLTGDDIQITAGCGDNSKIIDILYGKGDFTKTIRFNTLSGIIEQF